jgi:hypothetical protein
VIPVGGFCSDHISRKKIIQTNKQTMPKLELNQSSFWKTNQFLKFNHFILDNKKEEILRNLCFATATYFLCDIEEG